MDNEFKNRIGHDNFVWWIGVVERRDDPLNLGRVKVRIFGSHTDNLNNIPTDTLPWAIPMLPTNNSRTFSTPMEGDYAMGFFMDGLSCQSPVIMGVFPGIPQEDSPEGVGFSSKAKYFKSDITEQNEIKPESIATAPAIKVFSGAKITTTTAPAMAIQRVGQPTTPAQAYTLTNTSIQVANNNRVHVCDIATKIRFEIAVAKIKDMISFQATRKIKELANAATAPSPVATAIKQVIETIKGFVKMLAEAIKYIKETLAEIRAYIAYVQLMIAYIKSLPAKLLAMLQSCLSELISGLVSSLAYTTPTNETAEAISAVEETLTKTSEITAVEADLAEGVSVDFSIENFNLGMENYSTA